MNDDDEYEIEFEKFEPNNNNNDDDNCDDDVCETDSICDWLSTGPLPPPLPLSWRVLKL